MIFIDGYFDHAGALPGHRDRFRPERRATASTAGRQHATADPAATGDQTTDGEAR